MSIILVGRFRNERHILYEWVHHHLQEGIDKILLIDDRSDDGYLEHNDWLVNLVSEGRVDIQPSRRTAQYRDYDQFMDILKRYEWVIHIDLDEFMFCPRPAQSLAEVLRERYQDQDYLRIAWKVFAHSAKLQPKSVIEDNIMTHPQDNDPSSPMGIKCIARTRYLSAIRIHSYSFSTEVPEVLLSAHNPDIQLNHYRTQSDEFLVSVKVLRGGGVNRHSQETWQARLEWFERFTRKDELLKNKRSKLIAECHARPQVKPKLYRKILGDREILVE